ncbi:MAG: thiamine pyrophosphate-binding protein, partial [Azospirillaceae bacterium]
SAVAVTSTGTGAGNGAGALVEAMTAGTPLIHLTGQIDSPYLDRGWGFIHEAPDQPGLLKGCSKAFFRIARPEEAVPVLRRAIATALAAPTGPVSVEIPIDVQKAVTGEASGGDPLAGPSEDDRPDIAPLVAALRSARRPVLWLGGGARGAARAATALADRGVAIVTSVQGRGTVDERHAMTLGSFAATPASEALYRESDLMIVAGSHLRSNETRTYAVALPERRLRIDIDPAAAERGYPSEALILGDCADVLARLADALPADWRPDAGWADKVAAARAANLNRLKAEAGPYAALAEAVTAAMPTDGIWVRDITLSNSIWGNRLPPVDRPGRTVHAVGGGIGQGLQHAIGAGQATGRPVIALIGDGGFMLNPGELATAIESGITLVILLMNDRGYGVIRNIQDAAYGGRRGYTDLLSPDFAVLARAFGCAYQVVTALDGVDGLIGAALAKGGTTVLEIDMTAIGPFGVTFAGPPVGGK